MVTMHTMVANSRVKNSRVWQVRYATFSPALEIKTNKQRKKEKEKRDSRVGNRPVWQVRLATFSPSLKKANKPTKKERKKEKEKRDSCVGNRPVWRLGLCGK